MTTSPSTSPRVPDVAADLRRRIEAGEFGESGKLPSTRFLVDHYGISAQAIARVVGLLKSDGVVVSRQGAGVFVRRVNPLKWELSAFERGNRRDDVLTGLDDWKASVVEQGRVPEQRLISVTEEPGEAPRRPWRSGCNSKLVPSPCPAADSGLSTASPTRSPTVGSPPRLHSARH
ncbi:GntR family transcriptional regulator [Kitasatospora saccharophila]|uniref:GntR family transcriptional regulator n=1 Tax=Kitasatospora saccharophila TaxID=407973 RepID=UPI00363A04A1